MKMRLRYNKGFMWFAILAVVVIVVCTQLMKILPAAHAAGISGWESHLWPNNNTYPNVISDCNGDGGNVKPDSCVFHITSHQVVTQAATRVSNIGSQCKQSADAMLVLMWAYTSGTSVSESVSISVGRSLELSFVSSIQNSYDHSWSWEKDQQVSSGGSITVMIPANNDGWVTMAPQVDVYSGWMEVHYPSQVYGHYYWYYPSQGAASVVVTSPHLLSNGQQAGTVSGVTQPCGNHK